MYDVAKEYIRERFMDGTLDVTSSYENLRGFVAIMSGEMEAIIAIGQAHWLEGHDDYEVKMKELARLAGVNPDSRKHYQAWLDKIHT